METEAHMHDLYKKSRQILTCGKVDGPKEKRIILLNCPNRLAPWHRIEKLTFFSIWSAVPKNLQKWAPFVYIYKKSRWKCYREKFYFNKIFETHQVGLPYTCATCISKVNNLWTVPLSLSQRFYVLVYNRQAWIRSIYIFFFPKRSFGYYSRYMLQFHRIAFIRPS